LEQDYTYMNDKISFNHHRFAQEFFYMSRIHLIGNAHIDPVWLWPWQEGLAEVLATFRSALDRMQEYPEFIFTASSAVFYEWTEIAAPEMFKEIQQRVAEGRWVITGGWWIEPDCNIPGGEAFVRQGLLGQRYFQRAFGRKAQSGFCPDSFGHNWMLPQILQKSGLDNYVFMRPMPHEKPDLTERVFWWEGPDGSRVLTLRLPFTYATWSTELADHLTWCVEEIKAPLNEMTCFYGVGNHGGGPTIANLESLRRLQKKADLPELVFGSPDSFFAAARASGVNLPVHRGDLQHHATGCYAAQSGVKRWNRLSEHALLAAEKLAVTALMETGLAYPADLQRGWKQVLFNQFHDILAGSSIESAYEEARNQLGEARSIAGRASALALQSLAQKVNIPFAAETQPFIVFQPASFDASVPLEVETSGHQGKEELLDPDGTPIPFQIVQAEGQAAWRRRICFQGNVPALGHAVYRLVKTETPRAAAHSGGKLEAGNYFLENDFLRLEIDPATGRIQSLRDLRAGLEVFTGQAGRVTIHHDSSDTWSHDVADFHDPQGKFRKASVQLLENGPVRATIRVISEWQSSQLVEDYILYRGQEWLELRMEIDWHEHFQLPKLELPLAIDQPQAVYEIPFGSIQRPANGIEESGQGWVDLYGAHCDNGQPYGLALLNDGKYSFSAAQNTLELTILRSPAYAHHIPNELDPQLRYTFIDQGVQRFTLRLLPHSGAPRSDLLSQQAFLLNQPALIQQASFHPGTLPAQRSFVSVEPSVLMVSALKQSEAQDGLILRAHCPNPQGCDGRIQLWGRQIQAHFGPYEIKTFLLPYDPSQPIRETNLIEE
jgi:alpha-mannosidase